MRNPPKKTRKSEDFSNFKPQEIPKSPCSPQSTTPKFLTNEKRKENIFEEYRKQGEIQALKTKVSRALKDARTQFIAEYQFVWEYRVLIDASVRQLDAEGADGWELVSVSSYQTGGGFTLNGLGGERYTVHQQYTFKRRVISATNDAIRSLEAQLAAFDEPSVK